MCKCWYNIMNDKEICELCSEWNAMCDIDECMMVNIMTDMWKWINDYMEMLIDEGVL